MKYLFALIVLLPSAAFAQSPPPEHVPIPHKCDGYYPPDLQRAGVEGTTVISFRVKTSGLLGHLEVVQSSGNDDLDEAALRCARRWKYFPATQDGRPIEISSTASIVWKITDQPAVSEPDAAAPPVTPPVRIPPAN